MERGPDLSLLFINEKVLKAGPWASSTILPLPFFSAFLVVYLLSRNTPSVIPVFLSVMIQLRILL